MMRLSSTLVERTLSQFPAAAIPDSHPAVPQLSDLYGDHTFFLYDKGLSIVEPAEPGDTGIQMGKVVNLGSWNELDPPTLALHEPEPTEIVIVLGSTH
jgi:hypothetical protein